jgi:hypothetical protein
MEHDARQIFKLTLRAERGTDDATAIRALNAVLKFAEKRFGLRAVHVREHEHPCGHPQSEARAMK